jgi:hypothetical protein
MADDQSRPAEASRVASQPTPLPGRVGNSQLTPELVREVTEKVYALWRLELQLERERSRRSTLMSTRQGRG